MGVEVLTSAPLMVSVHSAEIFRLKHGDDHVYLHTNMPHPLGHQGGLALHAIVPRGCGEDWVHINFPGIETHLYDHTIGRIKAHNPAPLVSRLDDEQVMRRFAKVI